ASQQSLENGGSGSGSSSRASSGAGGRLRASSRPPMLPVPPALSQQPLPVPLANDQPLSDLTTIRHNGADIELKATELQTVRVLGKGRFGVVDQVRHPGTKCHFALKYLRRSSDAREHELQLREINVLRRAVECPFAVYFYGAMFHEGDILILMELMDASLRQLYLTAYSPVVDLPFSDSVLRYVAYSGDFADPRMFIPLSLFSSPPSQSRRDVKPSNMLASRSGQVKMCDFGIAGFLDNSIAKSNVGCELYLAPERILPPAQQKETQSSRAEGGDGLDASSLHRPEGFTSAADVWSLGVSLVELATGSYPYGPVTGPFELNRRIVDDPPPALPAESVARFDAQLPGFLSRCLEKNHEQRCRFDWLLSHAYLAGIDSDPAREAGLRNETAGFVCDVLDSASGDSDAKRLHPSEV
uniref:mitogen-activated protein kinase kinase n=1 Tax=Macrostomum lignano TaxID=282301 RepID=A0A1I8HGY6_9PLAT